MKCSCEQFGNGVVSGVLDSYPGALLDPYCEVHGCPICGKTGQYPEHAPGCDGARCESTCPVPVQCPRCGGLPS